VNQQEFFRRVLETLEQFQIPYMVVGSVGAMLHGRPRLTNDVDVVVELERAKIAGIITSFPLPEFYVPPAQVIHTELDRRGSFNIIHAETGSKVDLIIRKDTPHGREEFLRRRREPFAPGFDCMSARPEDVIIGKLRYYKQGGSEKHLQDISGMLEVSGDQIDMDYLRNWALETGLQGRA